MKILHILSQMPDFTGSGKTLQAIMTQAEKRGHDNFLVAGIQDDYKPAPHLIPPDHALYVRFNGIDLNFPLPGMSDVMPYKSTVFSSMTPEQLTQYEAAFNRKIQLAKERFSPDVIHTHHLWIVSKIAAEVFTDHPMVTSCHGTCLRQFSLCPEIGPKLTGAIRKIDKILCLSRHQQTQVRAIHGVDPGKIDSVGAGFDKELFVSGRKPEKGPVEIVYAGKLSRAKGVPWLLRSLHKMSVADFRLHLAGSGSGVEKEECLKLATSLGDKVIVHGALSHRELARLMRKAHLFILPSFFEGLPLVIMEALSSGCRIVTTALPGTRELLGHASSNMVDLIELPALETVDAPFEKDVTQLDQVLSSTLENRIRQILSNRQPDTALAREMTRIHTWENVFSRMETAYNEVCIKWKGR